MVLDIATGQQVDELTQLVLALRDDVRALRQQLAQGPADYLSVEEVGKYLRFNRRTVEKWAFEGEYNALGKRVYLPVAKYSGRLRFKRADVEAFGLGIGVLTPSLTGPPEPVKKPKKSKVPVASAQALKVA